MRKKAFVLAAALALTLILMTGCGPGEKYRDDGLRVLMETSQAPWTETVARECGLENLGKPYGTVREQLVYDDEEKIWRISFDLDEEITQNLVDSYAQAVWDVCAETGDDRPQSSSGYHYDGPWEAERRQEPLNYYIWYYHDGDKKFRVGLYPSEMEQGRPGGLTLEIQRWN